MSAPATVATPARAEPRARRGWMLRSLGRQPVTLAAAAFLVLVAIAAVFAPLIAPDSPTAIDVQDRLAGPAGAHLLGTDQLGRDLFSRVVYGARVALLTSVEAVGIGALIGVPVGLLAAYLGGWTDRVSMRVADALGAVPLVLFAFSTAAVFGPGAMSAMLAVGIGFAAVYARITRAIGLVAVEKPHVAAARVLGLSRPRILIRHVLIGLAPTLIVQTSLLMGAALLIEASLSFLGVGVPLGQASWGGMLRDAVQYQHEQVLVSLAPGIAITLTVLAFNLLGDGLRDALDARLAKPAARRKVRPPAARADASGFRAESAGTLAPGRGAEALLSLREVTVRFPSTDRGWFDVIDNLSLDVPTGVRHGIVGESGSGKSMTAAAIVGLVPAPGRVTSGMIRFGGASLLERDEEEMSRVRAREIATISQDPISTLSPVHSVGEQMTEGLRRDQGMNRAAARERAAELLERVGIVSPRGVLDAYPHQLSGGMAQRVVIASAVACEPRLLIADEPVTALDVIVQRQVLDLIESLCDQLGMTLLLISHDIGVVAQACATLSVMYAGQIVETGATGDVLAAPRHPYTSALLTATPRNVARGRTLQTIPGIVPPPWSWPTGCRFNPRCPHATARCASAPQPLRDGVRCERANELRLSGVTG